MPGSAEVSGPKGKAPKVLCIACRFFYITYEPALPYGCRAMNFKSRQMPSRVVFANSGLQCQAFQSKG
ncbi:uracil-DNA glycosylase [Desulfobacterota bacterium M19]